MPESRPLSKRIVITGVGVVSPLGIGKDAFWAGLSQGLSGIRPVDLFDTSSLQSKFAGQVADFKPQDMLGVPGLKNMDRTTKLSLCASKMALEDASLVIDGENCATTGVVLGSTNGSVYSVSEFDKKALRDGPYTVNPAFFPNLVMCSAPSQVAIRFGIKGMSSSVSSGFNSGLNALQYATKMLNRGHVDRVLVGSAEELCEHTYKAFYRLNMLSHVNGNGQKELNAPFDKRRNGFVLGEGAVVMMLETLESARARKTKIYAEVISVGEENSFAHASSLREYVKRIDDWTESIQDRVSIDWNKMDFISSGANSSIGRDYLEAKVVNKLSRLSGSSPATSAVKSLTGESFSAGVGFQILAALFCMETGSIFPTVGLEQQDDRCRVDGLVLKPVRRTVKNALVSTADLGLSVGWVALASIVDR